MATLTFILLFLPNIFLRLMARLFNDQTRKKVNIFHVTMLSSFNKDPLTATMDPDFFVFCIWLSII